ncbi:MAG: WecB/TagA/CpsF family glycosyltransferase [Leptolyngbyaceae cyanobacterium bins.59]|nr:WecB/TagA/CpsF family glycosyltransferase [Leptolyngbyaceae cyanobacterium bins.59]
MMSKKSQDYDWNRSHSEEIHPEQLRLDQAVSSRELANHLKPQREIQDKVNILNVAIDNISQQELLESLESGIVFTPNVDHLINLQTDSDFYRIYNTADYKICDSKILYYASMFLGSPVKEKISGSDFFPAFYQYHRRNEKITLFLLGGEKGVADRARDAINRKVGRRMVVGSYSPSFGFEKNEQECEEIIALINRSGATVLAVGVGAPKQEKWICKYKDRMPKVKILLAVGATLDFEAGHKPRAPQWVSEAGMEWLYRLMSEPKRLWKRYLVKDMPIFWLLLQQKLNRYRMPFENVSSE